MSAPRLAVILAAGEGTRLRPLTLKDPKCLAGVGGRRVIEFALAAVAAHGCRTARIVTGHLAQRIQDTVGTHWHGLRIEYVHNADYRTTNSMFSLLLGLDGVSESVWVLEGDIVFDAQVLAGHAASGTTWLVDSASRNQDGSYLAADDNAVIRSLRIVRHGSRPRPGESKSIGILRIEYPDVDRVRGWLRDGVRAGRSNDYYDLIVGEHLGDLSIHASDVAGRKWFEIDTLKDLEEARRLFL